MADVRLLVQGYQLLSTTQVGLILRWILRVGLPDNIHPMPKHFVNFAANVSK
jgi:hypothetical protein